MKPPLEIRESKKMKIAALMIVLSVFPAVLWLLWGVIFAALPTLFALKLIATAAVSVLFLFVVSVITKGLFSDSPALIINEKGIVDNSVQSGVGFIPWNDIISVKETTTIAKQKLLLFFVRNPIDYLRNASGLKLGVLTRFHEQFDTPIVINLMSFEYDPSELKQRIDTVLAGSGA